MMTLVELYNYCTEGRIKTMAELEQWKKDNPDKHPFTPFTRILQRVDRESLPLLDLSDVPPYRGVPGGVAFSLKDSMGKLAVLVCVCVILFYLSFIAFLRYDVR